uniref:Uncharacterized protein n=1 Tax=Myoviridae sp. ctMYT7 TaxID=2825087 RepID=A0A8S5Q4I6_9CAUD|nr:MAG TPA: hypothetical protein [Myoviridae sp. ctMYT7]
MLNSLCCSSIFTIIYYFIIKDNKEVELCQII